MNDYPIQCILLIITININVKWEGKELNNTSGKYFDRCLCGDY